MTWFVFAAGRRVAVPPGLALWIGRDDRCDITVRDSRISRRHLRIEVSVDESTWVLTDESANGTFTTEGRIDELRGSSSLTFALGGPRGPTLLVSSNPDDDPEIANALFLAAQPPEDGIHPRPHHSGTVTFSSKLTRFGRAPDNDVILEGALASAHHAHILRNATGLEIIDLASARGTFVNGERITRATLCPDDRVSMGGSAFLVTTTSEMRPIEEDSGLSLRADALSVRIGSVTLLNGISFSLPARKVLAVVGPSGSGKSTLLGALTGFKPATTGRVLINTHDLYQEYDEFRFRIGLVPQADLVPAQLQVKEALEFAAQLRFPQDFSEAERTARVEQVMNDLGLTERAKLRIDQLSGGQRKRVSVALEMLTKPSLMFLDEPTSGLDPGLDQQVMVLLREMADQGQTIIVVTHAVANLNLADFLLVLAGGGYVAYFGPPAGALTYFGVRDMSSVFLALDRDPGETWAKRWAETQPSAPESISNIDSTAVRKMHDTIKVSRPQGSWSQFLTLVRRNIKVVTADRTYATLLVVLPLILAATGFLVGNASGLGIDQVLGFNPEARLLLLILVLGSVFTGAATSIQELVKDRVIYQRERAVGLSKVAYVASKATVLGAIAAVQGFVFATLALAGRPGPTDPLVLPGHLDITVMVAAATVASCMLGLVLSSLLPTRDAALPALVIATMVQVVFSGAIPLRIGSAVDAIGWLMPAFWEFKAMAASVDLDVLLAVEPTSVRWGHEASEWWLSIAVLAAMALVFIALTIVSMKRSEPGRS